LLQDVLSLKTLGETYFLTLTQLGDADDGSHIVAARKLNRLQCRSQTGWSLADVFNSKQALNNKNLMMKIFVQSS
jgi:hypothetical protein